MNIVTDLVDEYGKPGWSVKPATIGRLYEEEDQDEEEDETDKVRQGLQLI